MQHSDNLETKASLLPGGLGFRVQGLGLRVSDFGGFEWDFRGGFSCFLVGFRVCSVFLEVQGFRGQGFRGFIG